MLKPLTIAGKTFSTNIIQGPLAGVSAAPFRQLVWQYSQPAYVCSEMISCKTILQAPQFAHQRFIKKAADEGPLCVQLSTSEPTELAQAVKIVSDFDVDLIDLNCGCPVKKIRKKSAGSKLLSDPLRLFHLIKAMKDNTHLPITVKIRVAGDYDDHLNSEILQVIKDAGADALIVHGRHWTENYAKKCRYDEIAYFANELTIPVIGNGDVSDLTSLKKILTTGCAGAMISRAGMGQPWLMAKMMAELNNLRYDSPKNNLKIFHDHIVGLVNLLHNEKIAVLQARKFAKYYARELINRAEFCAQIEKCESLSVFTAICNQFSKNVSIQQS